MRDLRLAVDELGAELDRDLQPGNAPRPAAPADAIARLEHQHPPPRARQLRRGGESGGAGANDDGIYWTLTPVLATTPFQKADRCPEPQQHEDVERHLGDRQIDFHRAGSGG